MCGSATGAAPQGPKRVLILDAYGRNYAPFSTLCATFQTELAEQSAIPIEFYDVPLQGPQFAGTAYDEPTIKYLRTLFVGRDPDLVVPVGGLAVRFALRMRSELFPSKPLLLAGPEEAHLLQTFTLDTNTTAVASRFSFPGLIEDMLRVLPGTTNVTFVVGRSALEGFWKQQLQRDLAGFTNRLGLTWLDQYSLEEMRKQVGQLPSHTVIFYFSMFMDAAGVPHEYDKALKTLHAEANAPMIGLFEEELGLGIVGGPLLSVRDEGRELAQVATRIFNGETPGNIHPPLAVPGTPIYDWRELRRWRIGQAGLPPGSIVRYRDPTPWERYRYLIIAAVSVVLVQSVLISGLLINLRQRRTAEAEAQRSRQELAHVNRVTTLGALAGSLAHELRQPLTAIVSSAQAAQRFLNGDLANDGEVRDALTEISEQGRRAGEIITEMRAMLKKETGQTAAQDLNLVVTSVLEMVRSDLVARGVTPELRLAAALPPVNGDGVQLSQVVLNLVTNACDSMSKEPVGRRKLTIESRRVEPNQVELSVADTGPGFPEEMLGDAFKAFHTTKAQGLGLGLAICQSIIMAHGGRLVATNNGNGGASVRLMLPARNGNGQ